jgi:hypothetical protein
MSACKHRRNSFEAEWNRCESRDLLMDFKIAHACFLGGNNKCTCVLGNNPSCLMDFQTAKARGDVLSS